MKYVYLVAYATKKEPYRRELHPFAIGRLVPGERHDRLRGYDISASRSCPTEGIYKTIYFCYTFKSYGPLAQLVRAPAS